MAQGNHKVPYKRGIGRITVREKAKWQSKGVSGSTRVTPDKLAIAGSGDGGGHELSKEDSL